MSKESLQFAKDAKSNNQFQNIWSMAMLIRELSTFKQNMHLSKIHKLNIDQGYNHIVIEDLENQKNEHIISRTSICEQLFVISDKYYNNATVNDLIYDVSDKIAQTTSF